MNISDIMTKKPITIRQNATLREALEIMEKHTCRHLPVVSGEGHLIGILSDRDCRLALNSPLILREKWQDEVVTGHTLVNAIMSPAPIIVEPDAELAEAVRLMMTHNISALPVMRAETLIGIVTTSDMLMALVRVLDKQQKIPHH